MGGVTSCWPPEDREIDAAALKRERAESEAWGRSEGVPPEPMPKGRARRAGVAASSVDQSAVDNYKPPVHAKDPAINAMLEGVIVENQKLQVLFGHLKPSARSTVVDAFYGKTVKEGEEVIRQGEEGDCLYIVGSGSVDVYVSRDNKAGSRGDKVVTLGAGALFGELALMYCAPRAATVVAASPTVELWTLDQEPFKMLLQKNSQQQLSLYEGWLKDVPLFKSLNHFELSKLSDLLDSKLYDEGEAIIDQGEVGTTFHILEEGECTAFAKVGSGEKAVKVYSKQGDYFGELALLFDEPRKASVRATGEGCVVATISRDDFFSILGPIKEQLMQHAGQYEKITA